MITLNVVTPLSRFENFPDLFISLLGSARRCKKINFRWWVVFDKSIEKDFKNTNFINYQGYNFNNLSIYPILSTINQALAGHAHRNLILDILEKGQCYEEWFYSLDDDNIIKFELLEYMEENEDILNCFDGLIVGQQFRNRSIRLIPEADKIKTCHVDTAMFLFKIKAVKGLRFVETDYCADGIFIEEMFNNKENEFCINKEPLSYYNYLRNE